MNLDPKFAYERFQFTVLNQTLPLVNHRNTNTTFLYSGLKKSKGQCAQR